jgi:N6-L-threonylcarbamoyladenine synthase
MKKYILGIDTSNYKTSVAVTDLEGNIIVNDSKLLEVKKGEKGLRQSEAFFYHSNDLPGMMEKIMKNEEIRANIIAVAVSDKPRPVSGSYMPVFRVGENAAVISSAALGVPLFRFSHQEGHIKAVSNYLKLSNPGRYIAYHLSGGTSEALLIKDQDMEIVGGSRDISLGQLIDRIGVRLGFDFPSGKSMDEIAVRDKIVLNPTGVKITDGYFNLSGLEAQCLRSLDTNLGKAIVPGLFKTLGDLMVNLTDYLSVKYRVDDFVFTGGVSSSEFLRKYVDFKSSKNIYFGDPALSSDNAVGIALLGGEKYA